MIIATINYIIALDKMDMSYVINGSVFLVAGMIITKLNEISNKLKANDNTQLTQKRGVSAAEKG